MEALRHYERIWTELLTDVAEKTAAVFDYRSDLRVYQPGGNNFYTGLWSEDYYFPIKAEPSLLEKDNARKLFRFLTEHIAPLDVLPDRIEATGHCVFQPGPEDAPHGRLMPLHLPASWLRLVDLLYGITGDIQSKNRWAPVFQKSFDSVRFENGLPFLSETECQVGYGFFDTIWHSGNDFMCSLLLKQAFDRAIRLYGSVIGADTIQRFRSRSREITENINRLLDGKNNIFLSDTLGCRQFSVWSNGLAYGADYVSEDVKSGIREYIWRNRETILKDGCCRQTVEPTWNKVNPNIYVNERSYQNGGFWAAGTAYVLAPLYDADKAYAESILGKMTDSLRKTDVAEWVDANGNGFGSTNYMMSLALPLLAVKAILNKTSLIEVF